jgi:5-methylcytosine-specific restriction endonuclease McrA
MFRRPTSKSLFGGVKKIRRDGYSNAQTKTSWWEIRKQVFDRDGGICRSVNGGRICGKPGVDVHHIVPLGRGGTTTKGNLITLCKDCHESRHRGHRKNK